LGQLQTALLPLQWAQVQAEAPSCEQVQPPLLVEEEWQPTPATSANASIKDPTMRFIRTSQESSG